MTDDDIGPDTSVHLTFPPDDAPDNINTRIAKRYWHLIQEGVQLPIGKALCKLPEKDLKELHSLTSEYFITPDEDEERGQSIAAILSVFYCLEKGDVNFTFTELLTEDHINSLCVCIGLYSLLTQGMIETNGDITMTSFFPETTFRLVSCEDET